MNQCKDYTECDSFKKDGLYLACVCCNNIKCPKYGKVKHSKNDPVNKPAHYTDGKIEVIEYIEDKKLGFCLGNAIKYISRAGKKNKNDEATDILKAIWYLNRYLKEIGYNE